MPKKGRPEGDLQLRIASYIKRRWPHAIFISDPAGLFFKHEEDPKKELPKRLKSINSERGRADLTILYPSRGYHFLAIELKPEGFVVYKRDGSLRKHMVTRKIETKYGIKYVRYDHLKEQADKLSYINSVGGLGRFGIGFDKTTRLLDWYFGEDQPSIF